MIHAFSSRCRRRGYSLTVVLLFLVLLLCLWAAVYRTTASFLRAETARVKRNDLDEGMRGALAQALWYLETNPTLSRTQGTYLYWITVPVSPNNPEGPNFTATLTPTTTPPNGWTILIAPGTCATPLPTGS
jgi:hypothetical protein